jgi:hypothetical protein
VNRNNLLCLALTSLLETKKEYETIHSIQLYSLHRPSSSKLTQVTALDDENFHEWNANLLSNSIGNIQLNDLKILPPGQKPKREITLSVPSKPAPLPRANSAPKQKTETKEAARSFFDKKSNSTSNSKTTKGSAEKELTSSSRPPLGTKKSVSTVKPSKVVQSSSPNPLVASEDESSDISQKDSKNGGKVIRVEDEDDEDEWEEGGFNTGTGGGKYVLDKEKIQKRDEIQSINDHFVDDESSEEEVAETKGNQKKVRKPKGKKRMSGQESGGESDTEEKKTKKQKKRQNKEEEFPEQKIQIHGAMDDFFEDMNRKQGTEATTIKKKRTKLVEKVLSTSATLLEDALTPFTRQVFADEKGYLVTEMVYEEVSEDETERAPPPLPPQSSVKNESTVGKDSGKKKASSKAAPPAAKGQQKSMMSYFSKK